MEIACFYEGSKKTTVMSQIKSSPPLRSPIKGWNMEEEVPSCPGWTFSYIWKMSPQSLRVGIEELQVGSHAGCVWPWESYFMAEPLSSHLWHEKIGHELYGFYQF